MIYNKGTYILLFFFLTSPLYSQVVKRPSDYDFIQLDSNHISYYGDKSALSNFYDNLFNVLEGRNQQLNVLHIGGSHIQADVWSGQVRRRILSLSKNAAAGRGLIFPYAIAKTNGPWNYVVESKGKWNSCKNTLEKKMCDIGLMGYEVNTLDSTAIIKLYNRKTDTINFTFSSIKVYHDFGIDQFKIIVHDKNLKKKHVNPTLGYTEFIFKKEIDTIQFQLTKTSPQQKSFKLFGFNLESNRPGIYYHAIGVNGADVPDYLRTNRLEQHLKSIQPDLVIFSVGINDAYHATFNPHDFKTNYSMLIKKIRTAVPTTTFLFTTNNDSYYKKKVVNKRGVDVQHAMMELSYEWNTGIWDMFGIMGGLGSIDRWVAAGLAKEDRIHFKAEGYRLIGDMMFDALMQDFEKYIIERK